MVGLGGWAQWLGLVVGIWLNSLVGLSGWTQWLGSVVGLSGWAQWLDSTCYGVAGRQHPVSGPIELFLFPVSCPHLV